MASLSIIIPVLNEASTIAGALARLASLRTGGAEIIVADGGSTDGTFEAARPLADIVIMAPRGRGSQMNAGAAVACGEVLLFLHADTQLPPYADNLILDGLAQSSRAWGRFDVTIAGRTPMRRVIAAMVNSRSRLSGIATGDQAMFVWHETLEQVGGFPDIALMEDIALSRRLKQISPPLCLRARVVTSGRRWDERGALRTILLMWRLRLAYFLGARPDTLARRYGYVSRPS